MNTLKERLTKQCNFLEIYEADLDKEYPKKEMGFLRCDFDGYRWWCTAWTAHKENESPELISELNEIYNVFIDEFPNLYTLSEFCFDHAQSIGEEEYNMFLNGINGNFWFRFILRRGDYNLYLHTYRK